MTESLDLRGLTADEWDRLDPHLRLALATFPQIDPQVEAIVALIQRAYGLIEREMIASLAAVSLTREEFKLLMQLIHGTRSHGALCKKLEVSTGAMTNRLDKLEREGLVARVKDPKDRRGVLIEITDAGRERIDAYMDRGSARERELLGGLSGEDKRELNALLRKLLDSLFAELGEGARGV